MNDPKLGAAMNAAAEKDLEDNSMKGLAELSQFKEGEAVTTKPNPNSRQKISRVPPVPSIAGIFDKSIGDREAEIGNVGEEIKRLDLSLADDMEFLQQLVQKININTDQVQALRSHLVRLKLEQAIHSTGVTSNYKSL